MNARLVASRARGTMARALDELAMRLAEAPARLLLLDYEGTLVTPACKPRLSAPTPEVLQLLARLAASPCTDVHVVSGRMRVDLERWLGHLPIGLHAEHGCWSRRPGQPWELHAEMPRAALARLLDPMFALVQRSPGAAMEIKSSGLAFHYRGVDPMRLEPVLRDVRASLLTQLPAGYRWRTGYKAVEIRPENLHKGKVVRRLTASTIPGTGILAAGDDLTDEDLFGALPDGAAAIKIGKGPSRAALRLASPAALRSLLRRLGDAIAGDRAHRPRRVR